jgi:addiction module HigA family antidote
MSRKPTHPGAVLREDIMPAMNISVTLFAQSLHVSRTTMHGILREDKPVTPNIALRLGKFIGNDAGVWLRMQEAYDLWHESKKHVQVLRQIKPFKNRESNARA